MANNVVRGVLTLALLVGACGEEFPARQPGERAPQHATCDELDATRCLLPWPSSTFTVSDAFATTGVRVAVEHDALSKRTDDASSLNLANGFSRLTPLVAGFSEPLAVVQGRTGTDLSLRLLLAQPELPGYGTAVPLRIETIDDATADTTLLFAFPQQLLEPNADYVVVLLDSLQTAAGGSLSAPRRTRLALDRAEAKNDEEKRFIAYHAPTRAVLDAAGLRGGDLLRVWDFTTRSADDATAWLLRMRELSMAAVDAGDATVRIDTITTHADAAIAAVITGRLEGLPGFVANQKLTIDGHRMPWPVETVAAPFRIVVPDGTGDYGVVMYGHGTGGDVNDSAFDEEIAGAGMAKVGLRFDGWTGSEIIATLLDLDRMLAGTHHSTARLSQSLAHGAAIQHALAGILGDALAAAELVGAPNPLAGRRPDLAAPMWVGGSLAGTMGFTHASVDASIEAAVLNVPGTAWSHWIRHSDLYFTMESFFENTYGGPADMALAAMMTQGLWDPIDGAVFDRQRQASTNVFLIQESIGDPILPNPGSEMVALTVDAVQVGVPIATIYGVEPVAEANGASAITQFKVASSDKFAIHGFAAGNSPAGVAAREQILAFFDSVQRGEPRITAPETCTNGTPDGSCDFSDP